MEETNNTISLDDIEEIDYEKEYPLPKPEQTFNKSTGDKTLYTQSISGNWVVYAESYKEAADLIVSQIQGNPPEDSLICPVIFMYRHYLEMMLKLVTAKIGNLSGNPYPEKVLHRHELYPFWVYIRQNIHYLNSNVNREMIRDMDRLIKEFASLDPDSMHYRYSQNKAGVDMPIPYSLDMENVKQVMQAVYNGLNLLVIDIDLEQEWLADYNSWCS